MNNKKIYLLNINLGQNLTGIESSALARARLMYEHLNLESIFVTNYYNVNLHDHFQSALNAGRGYSTLKLINLFDYFQDSVDVSVNTSNYVPPKNCVVRALENGDIVVYEKGIQIGYVSLNQQTKSIIFHNHIHQSKIWRRDWYDCRGFLSKIDFIDTDHYSADGVCEHYLRPNGTVAMIRLYQFDESKKRSHYLTQILNEKAQVIQQFSNEEDLLLYFLSKIIDLNAENIMILDRVSDYYSVVQKLKANSANAIKLIHMIHNIHYVHFTNGLGNPYTSGLNHFHQLPLENLLEYPEDHIIVFTEQQKHDIENRFGKGNIHVIPHSYAKPKLNPSMQRDFNKIIMLARFAEEKQHHLAIEAFSKVVQKIPEVTLELYGYGEKLSLIQETIAKFNLTEQVNINNFSHNIAELYQTAGLSLLSSRNEGFALVVMESLFYGCPVVSFECNYGPASMIQDGINGFLAPVQDVEMLANRMIQILENRELHQNMIKNAPASMEKFTHESIAELWKFLINNE